MISWLSKERRSAVYPAITSTARGISLALHEGFLTGQVSSVTLVDGSPNLNGFATF